MSFLAPASLWFLLILGPLVWLWRFTATRRTIIIPSLAPFRQLREQRPTSQWVQWNPLLLLQALLLMALVGALAQPRLHGRLWRRPRQTIVAILDNSASMRAGTGWSTVFLRAKTEVSRTAESLGANDQILVVTTAPPQLVTGQWRSDRAGAVAAINHLNVTDAPGDLAGAIQLAQSFIGTQRVHRFLVVTDEPKPSAPLPAYVEWRRVGRAQPNVALTQFELSGALAAQVPLTATVELVNFAEAAQDVEVTLQDGATPIAKQTVSLTPAERRTVAFGPFTLSQATVVTAAIHASQDALTADNTSTITRYGPETVGLALEGLPAQLQQVLTRLARSTPDLSLTGGESSSMTPPIRIVYGKPGGAEPSAPTLYLWPADGRKKLQPVRIVDWDNAHPLTRFLASVDLLPLMRVRDVEWPAWARTVVWGSDGTQSVPLVGVGQRDGFREVVMTFGWEAVNFEDPRAVELLILLLNSCHWLAPFNQTMRIPTGTPFSMPFVPRGDLSVVLPTGETRRIAHNGGAWEFPETWWAGMYHVSGGGQRWQFSAALMDERESNLMQARSSVPEGLWPRVASSSAPQTLPRPIDRWLWWMAAALFVTEWFVYQRRAMARSAAS